MPANPDDAPIPDDGTGLSAGAARQRLGRALREWHRRSGRTLKDLESEVHVSDSSLSRYFAGRGVPPWSVVERLAALCDESADGLRPLWRQASGRDAPPAEPAEPEPAAEPAQPKRSRVRPALVLAGVAVLFGAAGGLIGDRIGAAREKADLTSGAATSKTCADWPWPTGPTEDVTPAVGLTPADHAAPVVHLVTGRGSDGRPAVWARITGSQLGDRVWLDRKDGPGGAASWVQCGPFLVDGASGTSRAHDLDGNGVIQYRACGDVLRPRPGTSRDHCTVFW